MITRGRLAARVCQHNYRGWAIVGVVASNLTAICIYVPANLIAGFVIKEFNAF